MEYHSFPAKLNWNCFERGFPFAVILSHMKVVVTSFLVTRSALTFTLWKGLLLKICLANRHPLTSQYLAVCLSLWLLSFIDGWSLNTVVNRALISWNYCYKTMLMLFEYGWLSSFTASFDTHSNENRAHSNNNRSWWKLACKMFQCTSWYTLEKLGWVVCTGLIWMEYMRPGKTPQSPNNQLALVLTIFSQ